MTSPFSQASWIASPVIGSPRTSAPSPYFRKPFSIDRPIASARLTVTALGVYEFEINGVRVGDEIFAPGWTDYRKRVQYQVYEVGESLRPGENVLGAILGDGWYCGFVAWHNRQLYGDRPRLLAQLEVLFQDGSTLTLATDHSWKTTTGPILESDLLMGEVYDARLELGAWSQPGYNDQAWLPAIVTPPEGGNIPDLTPRLGPPVRRIEEIRPLSSSRHADGTIRRFDLGQNFSGRVRVNIQAPRGTTLSFRFAETLDSAGNLYTENLRTARATDYYICKGGENETWESRFTFHGFRFVEIAGIAPEDSLGLVGVVLHSDTEPAGTFRCSNELLNQLQQNIVWGQKSNFLEVPTDCPQRDERLGWTGDAQVFIRTACFNMNVQGFFHKWIKDIRDAQSDAGAIPCVIPAVDIGGIKDGGPAWSDATIICPWTIYLCYDDLKILVDHYESMRRFMDFLAEHCCRGRIRSHHELAIWKGFGDWLALDGSGEREGATPRDLIGTAFYAYDAEIMTNVAALLGHHSDAAKYAALHEEIVAAFRHRFVTPEGLITSGTQTSYVLALQFGLLPDASRATAIGELVRDIEKRNNHLATGFVGTPYLLQVLEEGGYLDLAYKLLEQETFPGWLFPVKNGATTIWERWDGWSPEKGFQDYRMNSFNHYAYGAVGAWMYQTVAGLDLDPKEPGYRHIIFRPRPGGSIQWAEAILKTPFGEAAIRWELKDSQLRVSCTVPEGCTATFLPPDDYCTSPKTIDAGRHEIIVTRDGIKAAG